MLQAIYEDTQRPVKIGDTITVPYHGQVVIQKLTVYNAGEWTNFIHGDKPCVVLTYGDTLEGEYLGRDIAISSGKFGIIIVEEPLEEFLRDMRTSGEILFPAFKALGFKEFEDQQERKDLELEEGSLVWYSEDDEYMLIINNKPIPTLTVINSAGHEEGTFNLKKGL